MALAYISFHVKDFDEWKSEFDKVVDLRVAFGIHTEIVYCHYKYRNHVLLEMSWNDSSEAMNFYQSSEFNESMAQSKMAGRMLINFNK
jgi:hypothetical protein